MSTTGRTTLAVIPARGGSKGLPGKNLADLAGLPLLAHAVRFAAAVPEITRCVVSTDDAAIAEVARAHGAEVPFLRPAELSTDATPMAPVLRHALTAVDPDATSVDRVVLLMATMPIRTPADVSRAIARLDDADAADADGVVSVSEPPFHPLFVGVRRSEDDVLTRYFDSGTGLTRRQDAERFLRITGQFYVWRAEFVRRLERSWLDEGRHLGVETHDFSAADVDTPTDLEQLRALVAAGLVTLP